MTTTRQRFRLMYSIGNPRYAHSETREGVAAEAINHVKHNGGTVSVIDPDTSKVLGYTTLKDKQYVVAWMN